MKKDVITCFFEEIRNKKAFFLGYLGRSVYLRHRNNVSRPCRCDWETHQIILNTEVASPIQWRATPAQVCGYYAW
jgi:hypothetical protein